MAEKENESNRLFEDEEAIIKMVDANLQRERISYSEKKNNYLCFFS